MRKTGAVATILLASMLNMSNACAMTYEDYKHEKRVERYDYEKMKHEDRVRRYDYEKYKHDQRVMKNNTNHYWNLQSLHDRPSATIKW